jgi:gamma-glutamyl:cysteine ligase YbdK (ATP-grasp superfamily)
VKIPQVAGKIIPEAVYSEADYQRKIFTPMYQAIASHDPEGILCHEFLNARGAIARFDRGAIEIRVLDIQETPLADLACAQLIVSVIKALTESREAELQQQMNWEVDPLAAIFQDVIRYGEQAVISDPEYLSLFGLGPGKIQVRELWQHLAMGCADKAHWDSDFETPLQTILEEGPLARRIEKAMAGDYRHEHLKEVYSRLCNCLAKHQMFVA